MNRDTFDSHPLWVTIASLGEVAGGDLTGTDDDRESIDFIHAAVQYLQSKRGVDPALIEAATLDTINNAVTTARDLLTQYKDTPEAYPGHLAQQVRPNLQSAVDQARTALPTPAADAEVQAAQEALDRYREAATSEIQTLKQTIEALQSSLAEMAEERDQQATTTQNALTTLEERIQQGEQTVATQTTTLQEQIETQRASFTEEAEQRTTKFAEATAAQEEKASEERDAQAEHAKAVIADLEKKREQAQALLDAVNNDVVSGDYKGWANKQASAAFGWTVTTVIIGLITVGALVAVVLTASGDTPQFLLSKSTVGIIGLILAGYTARQAAEHRHEERTANRLALDLAALEPYLEHVKDPDQLRTDIAKRVFVPERHDADPARFSLGRRSMSMGELIEFAKILRGIDQTGPPGP